MDFVVATDAVECATRALEDAGFRADHHPWSIHFKGRSQVVLQLSTEAFCSEFASRAVPAGVHGILMRVASLHDMAAIPFASAAATGDPVGQTPLTVLRPR
ncbi:MAG TPA: hypothetical protein PLS90_08410 [Candidatus Sumerlaeota bacterium]|nr:hypothetical protein [Candidatus Sumerlaeota bacterium]